MVGGNNLTLGLLSYGGRFDVEEHVDKCLPISGGSALGTGLFSTVVPYLLAFIKSSRVDVDVGGMFP